MEMRVAPPARMARSFARSSVSGRPPSTVNSSDRERSKCVPIASRSRVICGVESVVGVPPPMYRLRMCQPERFKSAPVYSISRMRQSRNGGRNSPKRSTDSLTNEQ